MLQRTERPRKLRIFGRTAMEVAVVCALLVFTLFLLLFSLLTALTAHSKECQRVEIRAMTRRGLELTQILRQLRADHAHHALSKSAVCRWVVKLRAGRNDLSTPKSSGRPPKLTLDLLRRIKASLDEDKSKTIRQLAREFNLSLSTIHRALRSHLKLKKRPAKWVLHHLTDQQKQHRLGVARWILGMLTRSPTLWSRIVTGDKSFFLVYDPAAKQSTACWLERNEEWPMKVRGSKWTKKVMLIAFWDASGVILREFVPAGMGVNGIFYAGFMRRLREAIRCKRPQMWHRNSFWLHHDGASAHQSDPVMNFLNATHTKILPHPPYSPDLAPSDFFLFNHIKSRMRGLRFATLEELRTKVDFEIRQIGQFEFQHTMEVSFRKCLTACIRERGNYFA